MSHEISLNNFTPMNNGNTDPQQSAPPPTRYPPANPQTFSPLKNNNDALQRRCCMKNNWFEDMRGWIMVVAVLVASVTYTSGLNPPGGFWQDDNGHNAGSPILRDKMETRYTTFFYANATAFMASLIIIILLMNENFYTNKARVAMLYISMVLDLASMMIAFAAGCARSLKTSLYVIVVGAAVLLFVILSSSLLPSLCSLAKVHVPGVDRVVGRGMFNDSQKEEERHNNMTKS